MCICLCHCFLSFFPALLPASLMDCTAPWPLVKQEPGLLWMAWVSWYVIILHLTRDSLVPFLEVKLNHLSPRNTLRPQSPVGADIPTIAACLFQDLEHSGPLSLGLCLKESLFPLLSGPSFPTAFLFPLASRCLFFLCVCVLFLNFISLCFWKRIDVH